MKKLLLLFVSLNALGGTFFAPDIDAPSIIFSSETANRACFLDASKQLKSSATTDTELGFISGLTSAVQTQLNAKASTTHASTHVDGGSDEIDSDFLAGLGELPPANFTPTISGACDATDQVCAWMNGIDIALGSAGGDPISGATDNDVVRADGATALQGNTGWLIDDSGNLLAKTDDTYTIGGDNASRPMRVDVGTFLRVGDTSGTVSAVQLSNGGAAASANIDFRITTTKTARLESRLTGFFVTAGTPTAGHGLQVVVNDSGSNEDVLGFSQKSVEINDNRDLIGKSDGGWDLGSPDSMATLRRPDAAYVKTKLGVGTSADNNAAAAIQVDSTTKGILFPRMTGTQRDAISSPPAGLVIYNTDSNKLNLFTTVWEEITSS